MKHLKILIFCFGLMQPFASYGQYFANNAFIFPSVRWMGFGSTANIDGFPQWPTTDQIQVGITYMNNIVPGYKLWYLAEVNFGFGYAKGYFQEPTRIPVVVTAATGLRYNFLIRKLRPFVFGELEWLQLFNLGGSFSEGQALAPPTRFWFGVVAGPGLEWVFDHNLAFQVDGGVHMLFDFVSPLRFSWTARAAMVFYF